MEITPNSTVPVKMLYNWAQIRSTQTKDQSPILKAILSDPFFTTCGDDEPKESSLCHIVANYWLITSKDAKAPVLQHIPAQYLKFLASVSAGQAFYDESLLFLLKRVGIPYLDINGDPHYHYFVDLTDDTPDAPKIEWRGLPHLFTTLCDHDPLKHNLARFRTNYISQPFFINFLRIMPFLYWAAQAYTQSIQLSVAIPIKDSLEIDGQKAFGFLNENTIKGYKEKDIPQGLYDLVLLLCQALTYGSTLTVDQRSPFVNRLLQIIGDQKSILLSDISEFLLCGEFGRGLSAVELSDLQKQTKSMAKRFNQSPWLEKTTFPVDYVTVGGQGIALFQQEFLKKIEAFEQLYAFLTSQPSGNGECSIM